MAPGGQHDGEIIAASLDRPERFTAVFERHFDAVHRYLTRRLGAGTADDLAATVFLSAFEARDRYDAARRDAAPWLYGIATNLTRRHHRSEARRWRAYERAARHEAPAHDDVDARLDASAHAADLARALRDLSADERDALLLFAWAGLSYEDVATATESPIGTVRSRIHRARHRLRDALDPVVLQVLDDPTPVPEG
jgi:RNA polymerase sigma-70 factor (ECF subfamily)